MLIIRPRESWLASKPCGWVSCDPHQIQLTITSFKTDRHGGSAKPSQRRTHLIFVLSHVFSGVLRRLSSFCLNAWHNVPSCAVTFSSGLWSCAVYNIIAHPVNMRTDWIKNTLLSLGPGKQFCHLLSTLISALGRLWRLYSMWQRRAGDSFSWHPGTRRTDTLLWSATLILIKRRLTRANEDRGCWWEREGGGDGGAGVWWEGGGRHRINTTLNEGRQWWRRWCGSAGGTSRPQAPWVSPLPLPLQGAQQQRLHFNYQVHLGLLMGHRLGGSEWADIPYRSCFISSCMFTARYFPFPMWRSSGNRDFIIPAWPVAPPHN